MVEMERTEWSDLRQENPNKIEAPDILDRLCFTDAKHGQCQSKMKSAWQQQR